MLYISKSYLDQKPASFLSWDVFMKQTPKHKNTYARWGHKMKENMVELGGD